MNRHSFLRYCGLIEVSRLRFQSILRRGERRGETLSMSAKKRTLKPVFENPDQDGTSHSVGNRTPKPRGIAFAGDRNAFQQAMSGFLSYLQFGFLSQEESARRASTPVLREPPPPRVMALDLNPPVTILRPASRQKLRCM